MFLCEVSRAHCGVKALESLQEKGSPFHYQKNHTHVIFQIKSLL